MRLKDGNVSITGIRPELLLGIIIADNTYFSYFGDHILITSGSEKTTKHSSKSLHYSGCAVDFRLPTSHTSILEKYLDECRKNLGPDFDLILEDDHYHLEYQPKVYNVHKI